jgi:hypothetical protein
MDEYRERSEDIIMGEFGWGIREDSKICTKQLISKLLTYLI